MKGAVSEMSPVMRQSFNTLSNTLQDKQKAIASSMREELSPIIDTYKEEIKVLEREVSKMRQELRRMYNNNDLYMKDVEKWYLAAAARAMYVLACNAHAYLYKKLRWLPGMIIMLPIFDAARLT